MTANDKVIDILDIVSNICDYAINNSHTKQSQFTKLEQKLRKYIVDAPKPSAECIKKSEQVLVDNGIEEDEADTVLQAIGYTLLDTELYPDNED